MAKRFLMGALVLALPLAACRPPRTGCLKDTDCKGRRVCRKQRCVEPPGACRSNKVR